MGRGRGNVRNGVILMQKFVVWFLRKYFTEANLKKAAGLAEKELAKLGNKPGSISRLAELMLFLLLAVNLFFSRGSPYFGLIVAITIVGFLISEKTK